MAEISYKRIRATQFEIPQLEGSIPGETFLKDLGINPEKCTIEVQEHKFLAIKAERHHYSIGLGKTMWRRVKRK
jgi:hypothetical protein